MMKKSTFGAILAFLAAAVGALTAAALYLRHRERELDEYEKLLFNDDYDEDAYEDEDDGFTVAEPSEPAQTETPDTSTQA